jgi:magnesium transporter
MHTAYHRTIRDASLQLIEKPRRGSWINVVEPDDEELAYLEKEFDLDIDLLKDGTDLYEAPRLERDGETLYIYTRFCRPDGKMTSTHPMLIVMSTDNVLTVTRVEAQPIEFLIKNQEVVTTQKMRLVLEILEEINKGFRSDLNSITRRILSMRNKLQKASISNPEVLNFIDMEEDLNEFLTALQPYELVLQALLSGRYTKVHERDEDLIEDLRLSTNELIYLTKSRLTTIQNLREAYSTITANSLNRVFKLMTSITILMSIFTIITGIYSMYISLPLAHNPNVFWVILISAATLIIIVGALFKKKKWL